MSSLLTNTSAMTALQSLTQTQRYMNTTENQISTGLAISSAAGNASHWSIATQTNSDIGARGAVNSALSESQSMIATMTTAMQSTISVMDAIKNDLTTAQQPGASTRRIRRCSMPRQARPAASLA